MALSSSPSVLKSSLARHRSPFLSHHQHHREPPPPQQQHHFALEMNNPNSKPEDHHHKIRRIRRALDSSDVELVKLMVMGEGLNLDDALALHYAVQNCSREVVKALLELGAADVNCPAGPAAKTLLHLAAEMVCPDVVAVLLDPGEPPATSSFPGMDPGEPLPCATANLARAHLGREAHHLRWPAASAKQRVAAAFINWGRTQSIGEE